MTGTTVRVVGTGYEGKEPCRYTTDVLREVVRRGGGPFGFEAALTSRVFTARVVLGDPAELIAPGRGDANGARRASTDLNDGFASLAVAGYRTLRTTALFETPLVGPATVVAGPLLVPSRWASAADRLMLGDVWRHVVVEEWLDDDFALCFDPTAGGYTAVSRVDLDRPDVSVYVVDGPNRLTDPQVLARHCFSEGARWRAGGSGDDRDEHGLLLLAARAGELLATSGGRLRLRLSLAAYALDTMRAAALLGFCGPLSTGQIALAESLADVCSAATDAHSAIAHDAPGSQVEPLRRMARACAAATELYGREVRSI